MAFPIKTCALCEAEFELRPDKPGYANRCPECSAADAAETAAPTRTDAFEGSGLREANAARRAAIKDMLYPGK